VQGLAPDVTALVGSVSKVLAPALRLGWLCVPPGYLDRLAAARAASDLGSPVLQQLAFAELLAGGAYDRHTRRARRTYRARRDAVVSALGAELPEAAVTGVAAGMHLLARLPAGSDDQAVVRLAEAEGLGPIALSTLYAGRPTRPGLVIGYAGHSPDQLVAAVTRLAAAVRRAGTAGPGRIPHRR
jgi:GntR family transcriptional regulator/MocR family aminotransferase